MVANWVYWWRVTGASKRIFATIKSTIDGVKFQIQYSYLHSNVIMCRIDIHTSYIYIYIHRQLMPWNIEIQFSCLHSNVIKCWQDDVRGNRLKYLMIFNRGIDTIKITALSNHKTGILNNYIRMDNILLQEKFELPKGYNQKP